MSKDMQPGIRWSDELNQQLQDSSFGVLCLTPENLSAPWLLFEAGSLAKSVSSSKVVPYLLEVAPTDIPSPLAQFQGVDADEAGTRKLLQSLNASLASPIDGPRLDRIFERWWPTLRTRLEAIRASGSPDSAATFAREISQAREAVHKFYARVAGAWWEQIAGEGIGFFQIQMDEVHNSVRLEGTFYNEKGFLAADWYSVAARVVDDKKMIVYLRECSHSGDRWVHGYGDMRFKGSTDLLSWGEGTFYDVNQAEKTVAKSVGLRRISDANEIRTMLDGTATDRASIVLKTIDAWNKTVGVL